MSFRDKAADGAVESRENSGGDSDNGGRQDYGIDVDFDETSFVRTSPTVFTTGVFPSLDEGNPVIRFKNAEYEEGRLDQGYLGLVLDDPEVIADEAEGTAGTVILDTDENDSTDYRLFNEDDGETKVIDDMGVKFGDRLYEGEILDEIPDDRIILTVSGASAKNVAKRLDKRGPVEADMDEQTGDVNDGLIEYKPNDLRENDGSEITSRYARDPELKESLHGQRIGLFLARREELDDENTGYVGVNGDASDTPLLGDAEGVTTHNDPDDASFAELAADDDRPERGMYWYVVFDVDNEEEVEMEVTDDEVHGYTYLHEDWGRFDPEAGRLPDDQWAFVEEYVEDVEDGNLDGDEETIRANVEDNAVEFDSEPETENIVSAITNQV